MRVNPHNLTAEQRELFQLSSIWWKKLMVRLRCKGRCELCGERPGVNLHHKTYARKGHELPEDLALICRYCHEAIHGIWLGWEITATRKDPLGAYWPIDDEQKKRMVEESRKMASAATAIRMQEAEERMTFGRDR